MGKKEAGNDDNVVGAVFTTKYPIWEIFSEIAFYLEEILKKNDTPFTQFLPWYRNLCLLDRAIIDRFLLLELYLQWPVSDMAALIGAVQVDVLTWGAQVLIERKPGGFALLESGGSSP